MIVVSNDTKTTRTTNHSFLSNNLVSGQAGRMYRAMKIAMVAQPIHDKIIKIPKTEKTYLLSKFD